MADVPRFERKTAFSVYMTVNKVIPFPSSPVLGFEAASFDLGNNFNLATDTYVVPLDGIYVFTATFVCQFNGAGTSRVILSLGLPGELHRAEDVTYLAHPLNYIFTLKMAHIAHFNQNDPVQLSVTNLGTQQFTMLSGSDLSEFSGYRIQTESRTILGG